MCLNVSEKVHPYKKCRDGGYRAKCLSLPYPIVVHKLLERDFGRSFYTPFQYLRVNFEDGKAELTLNDFWEIAVTTEPFSTKISVKTGFHSYYKHEVAAVYCDYMRRQGWPTKIFPAIIPANTKFFVGTEGDIVSEKLVIYENVNDYKRATADENPIEDLASFLRIKYTLL